MYCSKCQAQNADSAAFCTNCGASMKQQPYQQEPAQQEAYRQPPAQPYAQQQEAYQQPPAQPYAQQEAYQQPPAQPYAQQEAYQQLSAQPYAQQEAYQQPPVPPGYQPYVGPIVHSGSAAAGAALTFGILSLVLPIIGIIFGIVSIVQCGSAIRQGYTSAKPKVGRGLAIGGIVLWSVYTLFIVIMVRVFG